MTAILHDRLDLHTLGQLVRLERNAKQRDRYRAVLLAAEGHGGVELHRQQIAAMLGRSRQFVDEWVGRYRRGGIDNLRARKQPGNACRLTPPQQAELIAMVDAGAASEEGKSTFTGNDIKARIEKHFGVIYKLNGVYDLLHRLGYSWLSPRPRHPQADAAAQEALKKTLSSRSGRSKPIIPIGVC